MVTEKVDGVELSTYGLRLAKLDGNCDLPGFKDIIDEHNYESNLLKLDEKTVRIKLIGFYGSKPNLGTSVMNFYTKLQSGIKFVWLFTNHGFNETCVVKDGINCYIYGTGVEIYITLTITAP